MPSVMLKCSEEQCKSHRDDYESLSYEELYKQLERCEKCENGLFKDNEVAAQTYYFISILWAQKHNALVGTKKTQ